LGAPPAQIGDFANARESAAGFGAPACQFSNVTRRVALRPPPVARMK